MSKATPVTAEDWKIVSRIKNSQDFFNYLCRPAIAKNAISAKKVHQVEFFPKP